MIHAVIYMFLNVLTCFCFSEDISVTDATKSPHLCTYCALNIQVKGQAEHGYYVTTQLGTPPQQINIFIDTGSSNLAVAVVPSKQKNSRYFHYNQSLTLHPSKLNVDIHYAKGSWSGFLAKDVINLLDEKNSSAESTIACMTSINNIFDINSNFEGILGLAYPALVRPGPSIYPFLDDFIKTKNMRNIFALSLCGPYFSNFEQQTMCGQFHVGYISMDHVKGDVMYTPIIKEWYYEVMLTDFKVGLNYVPNTCLELNKDRSIIDSGTTNFNLPETVYYWTINQIKNHVNQAVPSGFWVNQTVVCFPNKHLKMSTFPTLTISLYHSRNSSFNLLVSPELYLLSIDQFANSTCAILAIGISDYGTVIGSTILKGFYVIFDREDKTIGFANLTSHNNLTHFVGSVTIPIYTDQNFNLCKREDINDDSSISVLTIILLCCAVACAIALLYMLLSWIWRHFVLRSFDSSETSSLVDDD